VTGIIIFILVLSLLIFVHELGHFLAAKWCNIYVDRFSIGMPPRVAGFRIGETDYCISALPLGGYVKMAGQEDAPLSDEEREKEYGHVPPERFFNAKPVWQRFIVLVAGPLMNLFLAFAIYIYIAASGAEVPVSDLEARVGVVREDAPAETAPLWELEGDAWSADTGTEPDAKGWRTGDLVLRLDGEPVKNMNELALNLILGGPGVEHEFVLQRERLDGTVTRYYSVVAPELLDPEESDYPMIGVGAYSGAQIDAILPDHAAADSVLQAGDIVRAVNGEWVDRGTFVDRVSQTEEGQTLSLTVERDGEFLQAEVTPTTYGRITGAVIGPFYDPETGEGAEEAPVVRVVEDEYAENANLRRFDRIVQVEGEPATAKQLYELEKARPGGTLDVTIKRPTTVFGIAFSPDYFGWVLPPEEVQTSLPVESVRAIGVTLDSPTVYDQASVTEILPRAWEECRKQIGMVTGTLSALFSGAVSAKELGGPVTIARVTMAAAESGWERLFRTTAFISLNLFILNLLPLPVLDGGQIVLITLEAIRRKPLSMKTQERIQTVGVACLLGLMLYVTWNDLDRLLDTFIP